jgi:predicted dehydrogenase
MDAGAFSRLDARSPVAYPAPRLSDQEIAMTDRPTLNRRAFVAGAAALAASGRAFSAQTNRKPYRVGVIGHTGRGNYGHGLDIVWREVPETTVVAVADANDGGRAAAQKRLKAPQAYADYRKMLEAEKPDLVSICPRHLDQHRDMLLAVVAAGVRGIYLEKPLCRTLAEADAMVAACEKANVKVAVAHQTRYCPRLKVVRDLIGEGRIGTVVELRGRGKEDRRGGGEDLWVLGTHVFDLMRAIAGEPRSCFATVTQDGRPITKADVRSGPEGIGPLAGDAVHALYTFPKGITATFDSVRNMGGRPTRFGLSVYGSKGIIELRHGYLGPTHILEHPSWSPGQSGAKWTPITSNGIGKPETLKGHSLYAGNVLACKDLIACLGTDKLPYSSIQQARGAVEMIAAVFESQRLGKPTPIPLTTRQNPLTLLE